MTDRGSKDAEEGARRRRGFSSDSPDDAAPTGVGSQNAVPTDPHRELIFCHPLNFS